MNHFMLCQRNTVIRLPDQILCFKISGIQTFFSRFLIIITKITVFSDPSTTSRTMKALQCHKSQ